MPPMSRKGGTPGLSPSQSVRRGLRLDELLQFEFKPSIGISAKNIDRLGLDIRSFREPLKRVIQQVLAPSFRKNFESGGRPDAWEPLSDATMEIRDRLGFSGDDVLVRTGALQRVSQQFNIWVVTGEAAFIPKLPDKVRYGNIHQSGYGGSGTGKKMGGYLKKAKGDAKEAQKLLDDDLIMAMRTGQKMGGGARTVAAIPQRQFILLQDEDYDEIERVFVEWLTERAVRAGFVGGIRA
jgi:phage gpG-like protein